VGDTRAPHFFPLTPLLPLLSLQGSLSRISFSPATFPIVVLPPSDIPHLFFPLQPSSLFFNLVLLFINLPFVSSVSSSPCLGLLTAAQTLDFNFFSIFTFFLLPFSFDFLCFSSPCFSLFLLLFVSSSFQLPLPFPTVSYLVSIRCKAFVPPRVTPFFFLRLLYLSPSFFCCAPNMPVCGSC